MQTCVAALRLPVRMSVEWVSGCWWAECPDGVESAVDVKLRHFFTESHFLLSFGEFDSKLSGAFIHGNAGARPLYVTEQAG